MWLGGMFSCTCQEQQRQLLHVVELLMLVWRLVMSLQTSPGHVSVSLHSQRFTVCKLQASMVCEQWRRFFSMELHDMQDLFALISDSLHRNLLKAIHSARSPILPQCRLLMGIQW